MEKLTNEQREARSQAAQEYRRTRKTKMDERKAELPENIVKILGTFRAGEGAESELALKLRDGLISGEYKRPSEFVKKELAPVFGILIPEALVPSLLYQVDNVREYPYTEGWHRRTFRSDRYEDYLQKICTVIHNYSSDTFDASYPDYLTGKVSEEQMNCFYVYSGHLEYDIAYNIDIGNAETIAYITDVLNGGIPDEITYPMLRAVFMSKNRELHELAGKLLLAAKLQEGLRQAICETCDMGTVEAFRYMIGIITENDLIRFSAVKRAVGTWTGLMAEGCKDLDRISGKTMELIVSCLDDEKALAEALASDDAMKIHIALWAQSVRNAREAVDTVKKIAAEGTHPQVMAAGYFTRELFSEKFKSGTAKAFVLAHSGEPDVLALTLGNLFAGYPRAEFIRKNGPEKTLLMTFTDRAEAEEIYSKLWATMETLPKKALTFSPCVFPWNEESFSRSDIIRVLAVIAAMLEDDDKKDGLCPLIAEIDASKYSRANEVHLILDDPKTETQTDTAVAELADKESYARGAAYMIVSKLDLEPRHFRMIEDMLRYKAADIRSNVFTLLMKMDDEAMYTCVERLLSDKKEEKRTAGLDIIMQLGKNEERRELYARCLPLVTLIKSPTTKEQILIDQLRPSDEQAEEAAEGHGLYTSEDSYIPVLDENYLKECEEVFVKYFPSSELIGSGKGKPDTKFIEVLKALDDLIEEHKNDEFTSNWGEKELLGAKDSTLGNFVLGEDKTLPFMELWDEFYDKHIKSDPVLQYRVVFAKPNFEHYFSDTAYKLFGQEFRTVPVLAHEKQVTAVLAYYGDRLDKEAIQKAAFAMMHRLYELAEDMDFYVPEPAKKSDTWRPTRYYVRKGELCKCDTRINDIFEEPHIRNLQLHFSIHCKKEFPQVFALRHMLAERLGTFALAGKEEEINSYYSSYYCDMPEACYVRAAYEGIISEGYMYRHFFEECLSLDYPIMALCGIVRRYRDTESGFKYYYGKGASALAEFLGVPRAQTVSEEDRPAVEFAAGVYDKLIALVLDSELRRGDSPAEFTKNIRSVSRIYGVDRFVQILSALGRDTLERSNCYDTEMSKRSSLSHLLLVCMPREGDTAETLREKLKGTDITEKRLVEAALYSEGWIQIVGEYLGWEGFESACYYFISHMNESFSERQKALFAKYTPITTEELAVGAFDIDWFKEANAKIGDKHFDMIYDAAKYITDGAKHSRARKYADAVRGRLALADAEKQIHDKRNKDTLMAAALIPLSGDEDVLYRYKLFMQFKKESSGFGAQRKASETAAVDMAMRNLAENAGFTDVTRLTMRMETMLFDGIRQLTEPQALDDITLRLVIDEQGKCEIECMKGGKALKSIPAKYKKNELVVTLTETKKQLTEQHRRTRLMFEQAMEDMTFFTAGELSALTANPVVAPIVRSLVLTDGKGSGLLEGLDLISLEGKSRKLKEDTALRIAHPFDLYSEGTWRGWQKLLFEKKITQAFRQVFRELYVKTEDERGAMTSLRYAGNQIQPKKTAACLKSRRWVADVEDGLQKVYYKHDIIARIYALADWFSPADIEAPTLEWVDFFDRKTGEQKKIDDIPDIIFSEVMRDVDLAVSVAHAGGVDPEASHSTVELRRAVCEFTLPLFGLTNVTFEKSHAFIKGGLADYSVHLGSGVVHIQGGAMINILPVHSQHRGRLFLPFVDDDPKTAQIVSEILLFADDRQIKDPFILDQIR